MFLAHWSSGEDIALSKRRDGFDSRMRRRVRHCSILNRKRNSRSVSECKEVWYEGMRGASPYAG